MGAAGHLGIRLRDYDVRIRTFIPHYEALLDAAAAMVSLIDRPAPTVVELGIGSGALAARCLAATPKARIVGVDSDAGMLAMAGKRLGAALRPVHADLLTMSLPACDAVVASFALHHIPTLRQKRALYARCARALRRGGVFVSADWFLATGVRLQARDRHAWRSHLERRYSRVRAAGFLDAWAKEDVYTRLEDERAALGEAGLTVDVPWRRDGFAVIVGTKTR